MKKWFLTFLVLLGLLSALTVTASAATNTSIETATPITIGETIPFTIGPEDQFFSVKTTKPGQYVTASVVSDYPDNFSVWVRDANGIMIGGRTGTTSVPGNYFVHIRNHVGITSGTLIVTLSDNDNYEPNGTKETAVALKSGNSVDITLWNEDQDWFVVETDEDGQDIRFDFSGFTYDNQGSITVGFDESYYYSAGMIEHNESRYFHAAKAGKHYIKLSGYGYDDKQLTITMTATVVDGDRNECNDTKAEATSLALGTDKSFNLGGWEDEDWFRFDVVPDADGNNLYTLRFLDLNPDYSDQLLYEVYGPSGNLISAKTKISITHANILSCAEQGTYYIRVFTGDKENGYFSPEINNLSRSDLRIRVSKGGNDPHESNDTWLTAAPIQVGQLTQHVLSAASDQDWFYFTAPEADMSFAIDLDRYTIATLYRAETLAETGNTTKEYFVQMRSDEAGYCKLDNPGVYYLQLTTRASDAVEDLRSFMVTLTDPGKEENNDTWDKAIQLFKSVPQTYDIVGANDEDWFKIIIPEGMTQLHLNVECLDGSGSYVFLKLYRQQDIINVGLDANAYASGSYYSGLNTTVNVSAGTYYLKIMHQYWHDSNQRAMNHSITYHLSGSSGVSMADAVPLPVGMWSDPIPGTAWFSLGELKQGDVVRYTRESAVQTYIRLFDSKGNWVADRERSHDSFIIQSNGSYYLRVDTPVYTDDNGDLITSRIRYDIGSGEDYVTVLDGPDSITLHVGQTQFIDLHLTPTDAYSSGNYITLRRNTDSTVTSWSYKTGYVGAMEEGSTIMTFEAYIGNGDLTKDVAVTVLPPVLATDISIANVPQEMFVGDVTYLKSSLTPADTTEEATWSSSNPSVLYVFPGGKAVAVGEGTATVTAVVGELTDTVTIQVNPAEPTEDAITSVLLDKYALTMYMEEEAQTLTESVQPAGINAKITWTSSNINVATVDQSGTVTAIGPGISIITAAAGDHSVSCVVTVQAPRIRVTGITFADEKLIIPLGSDTLLEPTIVPYNATTKTLTWVSDDITVATVSRTGEVHALAVGETVIRATTLDGGFVAEITIEVAASPRLGDINGDGYIDSGDAILCLRNIVGLTQLTEQQLKAGDVNHDGIVDAGDAVKILRYNAKLIDSLE